MLSHSSGAVQSHRLRPMNGLGRCVGITATDGNCQTCPAKLWLQMGIIKIVQRNCSYR